MRTIKVDTAIYGIENISTTAHAGKVIKQYVKNCPDEGLRVEGANFVLNITPLQSAVGRQEWLVEIINTALEWEPVLMAIYDVRKRILVFHFAVGR